MFPLQPKSNTKRSVKKNTSFQNKNKKKQPNVFMTRLRCVLVLLIITMASTLIFMFQMAYTSNIFTANDTQFAPVSAALREHSIFEKSKRKAPMKAYMETAAKARHLKRKKHEHGSEQQPEDQQSSKARHLTRKKHEQGPEQQPEDKQFSKHYQHPKKKLSSPAEAANERPNVVAGVRAYPNHEKMDKKESKMDHLNKVKTDKSDAAQRYPASKPHNVFKERATDTHEGAIQIEMERTLRQQERDAARKEAFEQGDNNNVLIDKANRGGSAGKAKDGKGLDLGAALDEARDGTPKNLIHHHNKLSPSDRTRFLDIYNHAVQALQDPQTRQETDPLFVNSLPTSREQLYRIPYQPKVPYLGVLVDAGRHYFPIKWWKQLIVYLYQLRFNLIQWRLTDDQTFNIQLESYPQLANPVLLDYNQEDKRTYSAKEVRDLVQFAKQYNISMIPEINIPGHAGGWAGIPNLVVICPEFICNTGYGLPLDIEHPQINTILKGVLEEVLDIFDNPPFLHLGGDEVNMADPCFYEVGRNPFNYSQFENNVKGILKELKYPNSQVIRWERTGQSLNLQRAGLVEHYWESLPNMKHKMSKLLNGEYIPWFASRGLYFDTNHQDDGYVIHRNTITPLGLDGVPPPRAIIAGTFELGTEYWLERNVATRLISVAMGASKAKMSGKLDYMHKFNETCHDLGVDSRWCDLQGATATEYKRFMKSHGDIWKEWKNGICERLTVEEPKLTMKDSTTARRTLETTGYNVFWQSFGDDPVVEPKVPKGKTKPSLLGNHVVPLTGVIFDMVNSMKSPPSRIHDLLKEYVAPLGFQVLHLRLIDDNGFGIQLESQPKLGYSALKDFRSKKSDEKTERNDAFKATKKNAKSTRGGGIPAALEYRDLVASVTSELGMQIIPEVSFSTNAGGWLHSGFATRCPETLCDKGGGVTNGIAEPELLPVVYSVLRELRQIFSNTPFIHLGHDNRQSASHGCLQEVGSSAAADPMKALSEFEEKLELLAFMLGIEPKTILRWNNEEDKRYSDRTGHITHYKAGQLPKPRPGEEFFVTVDILSGSPWSIYKQTRDLVALQPKGILGEVRDIGDEVWTNKNVGLRLVAFALGLQESEKELDERGFEELLVQTCEDVQLQSCNQPDRFSKVSATYEVDQSRYKDKMCSEFTFYQMGRVPAKKFITTEL